MQIPRKVVPEFYAAVYRKNIDTPFPKEVITGADLRLAKQLHAFATKGIFDQPDTSENISERIERHITNKDFLPIGKADGDLADKVFVAGPFGEFSPHDEFNICLFPMIYNGSNPPLRSYTITLFENRKSPLAFVSDVVDGSIVAYLKHIERGRMPYAEAPQHYYDAKSLGQLLKVPPIRKYKWVKTGSNS